MCHYRSRVHLGFLHSLAVRSFFPAVSQWVVVVETAVKALSGRVGILSNILYR